MGGRGSPQVSKEGASGKGAAGARTEGFPASPRLAFEGAGLPGSVPFGFCWVFFVASLAQAQLTVRASYSYSCFCFAFDRGGGGNGMESSLPPAVLLLPQGGGGGAPAAPCTGCCLSPRLGAFLLNAAFFFLASSVYTYLWYSMGLYVFTA